MASFIGNLLDVQLIKLAKAYKLTYSRYADDLTFSSNDRIPKEIIYWNSENKEEPEWVVGKLLKEAIEKNNFLVNNKKTRLFFYQRRQTVTGIIVNKKLNATSHYRKKSRAMLHKLFTQGGFFIGEKKGNINQLIGRLNYVASVKYLQQDIKMSDREWIKERDNFESLCARHFDCSTDSNQSVRSLRQAIFFKYFINNSMPIIIPEGKTDSKYFRLANKILNKGSKNKYIFQNINTELAKIGLGGGTIKIKNFLKEVYKNNMINLSKIEQNSNHPAIFILDYDKGLLVKGKEDIPSLFNIEDGEQWKYIRKNIYLLLLKPRDGNSFEKEEEMLCVENLLEHNIMIKVDEIDHNQIKFGKLTFSKVKFLRYVESHYQQFNFSKFRKIFSAIEEIRQDYQYKKKLNA